MLERKKPITDQKIAIGIIAIIFGCFGVHKFLLGYIREGLIMLGATILLSFLFCIGPLIISGIGLIEGIIYLTMSDEDFKKTYIENYKPWF